MNTDKNTINAEARRIMMAGAPDPRSFASVRFVFKLALVLVAGVAAGCSLAPDNRFQGYIEGEYVYVSSPLAGALTNLAVARGNSVTNGQLLFELERQSEAAKNGHP